MLPVSGGEDAFGRGVQDKDDGSGKFVPEEVEGSDSVQGVRGGDGSEVAGGTHVDTGWETSGGETLLGKKFPGE